MYVTKNRWQTNYQFKNRNLPIQCDDDVDTYDNRDKQLEYEAFDDHLDNVCNVLLVRVFFLVLYI